MKKILPILTFAFLVSGCADRSAQTTLPPVWALGYWQQLPEGTDIGAAADSISAIRNSNSPLDVFDFGANSVGSEEQREFIAKANAHVAADLESVCGASEAVWKQIKDEYAGVEAWVLGNLDRAAELARGMRKDGTRPCLLSAMDPDGEMLGVARRISAGEGWEGLREGLQKGLELSRKGVPFWQLSPAVAGSDADELRTRALQLQSFLPMPCTDVALNLTREQSSAVKMRYKLVPTVYTAAAEACFDGTPIVQPLDMAFAADEAAAEVKDEFLFGGNILIAPVLEAGATEREVYLPAGCKWYDYATDKLYEGGTTVTVPAPLSEELPLFCKAGSMVFVANKADHFRSTTGSMLIFIYPDGNDIDASLYTDDGESLAYEKGKCCWIKAHWNEAEHLITLSQQGDFEGNRKQIQVFCFAKGVGDRMFDYNGGEFTTLLY